MAIRMASRREQQAENRGQGARRALESVAEHHRQIDRIGARQNAGGAEQFGEFKIVQPAAFLDDDGADPAGDAAETANPDFEERAEQRVMGDAPHQTGRRIA